METGMTARPTIWAPFRAWLGVLAAVVALAPLSACARPDSPPVLTEPAAVDADPALWVVRDADTTIYLFGTVHVLKPGLSWFDEAVRDAFDSSDSLVLEVADGGSPDSMAALITLGTATDGKMLRDRMSAEARARYEAAMTARGLDPAMFDRFDPWMAAINLTVIQVLAEGYDPQSGAEKGLEGAAKAAGKPIAGLETARQQLGFFDSLPMESQLRFLDDTVSQSAAVGATMEAMVAAWGKGDTAALEALLNAGFTDPAVHKVLLTDRNARWSGWIEERLEKPGTVFMAVGAGHLAGAGSVQEALAARGIAVKRIDY
jgi:uncharacterized protein YbaP (TraB family)